MSLRDYLMTKTSENRGLVVYNGEDNKGKVHSSNSYQDANDPRSMENKTIIDLNFPNDQIEIGAMPTPRKLDVKDTSYLGRINGAFQAMKDDNDFQDEMRRWHFKQDPEYPYARKKSRLIDLLIGGGSLGLLGMLGSQALINKYKFTGWKKWLTRALLGGGGALAGSLWGLRDSEPPLPDEYKRTLYDHNGKPISGPLS